MIENLAGDAALGGVEQRLHALMMDQGAQKFADLDVQLRPGRARQLQARVLAQGRAHGGQGPLHFIAAQIAVGAGDIFTHFLGRDGEHGYFASCQCAAMACRWDCKRFSAALGTR